MSHFIGITFHNDIHQLTIIFNTINRGDFYLFCHVKSPILCNILIHPIAQLPILDPLFHPKPLGQPDHIFILMDSSI